MSLPHAEVEAIFDLLIEANIPEMTAESLTAKRGFPFQVEDGSVYTLELHFETYTTRTGETMAPFTPRLEMDTPELQLRQYPGLEEVQGFIELRNRLASHFSASARETTR